MIIEVSLSCNCQQPNQDFILLVNKKKYNLCTTPRQQNYNQNIMQKNYKGQYNPFKFQMKFLPEEQKLFITLENKLNYHLFKLTINHDFVKDRYQWKNIIEYPSQIYQYISQNFNKVVFLDDGTIRIAYQFSHTHRVIQMLIKTEKINRDPVQILQLRFKDLHEEFNQERRLNTILIHQLLESNKKVQTCEVQIQQLKEQNHKTFLKIQEVHRLISAKLIDQKREQILTSKLNISQAEIRQVRKQSAQIRQSHKKDLESLKTQLVEKQIRPLIKLQLNEKFETDCGISEDKLEKCKCFLIVDKSKFKVIQSGNSINLTLADTNQWYTYVNQQKIQSSKTFKITVKKATKHNMYIGLATGKINGIDMGQRIKGSCLYSFWGNLYNGGILSVIGTKITTNDEFQMKIDYKQSILYFQFLTLDKEQIHIIPLPLQMKNQALYLVVKSSFRGDQLQIVSM